MIDDICEQLDGFLVRMEESQESSGEGGGTTAEVSSLFLEGLEFYCLLKQRLLNVQYCWRHMLSNALPPCYKGKVK